MRIGIGLPTAVPGTTRDSVLRWARAADAGPFSSLGATDRVAFRSYEPLMALAAAASVTERIHLMTTVLVAPLRTPGMLAKQVTTLHALCGGRLTLGLAVGGRRDDFEVVAAPFGSRGRRFEKQLEQLSRMCSGGPMGLAAVNGVDWVRGGNGPELLIGGYSPRAIGRLGRFGDGYLSGAGADPERAASLYSLACDAWRSAGRQGRPRFVGCTYFALGDAVERGRSYLRHYYEFLGPRGRAVASAMIASEEGVQRTVAAARETGMDELVFWPCVSDLNQLERLSTAITSLVGAVTNGQGGSLAVEGEFPDS